MVKPHDEPEPKRRRNPLWWAALGAFATFLPPWHFRDFVDFLVPGAAVLFLIAYFAKSRFAWHILAANILFVTPMFFFLSPSWRLQTYLHPEIIWFPIVTTIVFLALLFWSRRRYLEYLAQSKEPAATPPI